MGVAQSVISEAAVTAVVVAGAAAVAYGYARQNAPPSSQALPSSTTEPSSNPGGKKKKKKQGDALTPATQPPTDASPVVIPFPAVVPGSFDAPSDARDTSPPASTKAGKPKKKKGKKAGAAGSGTPRSQPADAMSESSATAPESPVSAPVRPAASKSRKSSTPKLPPVDTDESWTRVESRRRPATSTLQPTPAEAATPSDAGVTTMSMTGNSSPVTERTDDELASRTEIPVENRRTLAERLLPRPRKTGVDDMLETSDYPTVARVMRIAPGPDEKPAAGFSWGDYEDVDDARVTADDADGEDDGGWGVVKSRGRPKAEKTPVSAPTAPESLTKKQRQNAAKRDAQKAAKAEAEAERQARLAKHSREVERAKIAEQYAKSSKSVSGGMTAYVDENGKLVWK